MKKSDFELIICIVNSGFSDTVMEAARQAGAGGGTVMLARGTANREAEQFFNITIHPDKEMLMVIVPANIKDDVMHAIYRSAGPGTDGQGIAFSVPVDSTAGLYTSQSKEADNQKTDKKNVKTSK